MSQSELKTKTIKGLFWGGFSSLFHHSSGLFFTIIISRLLSPSEYGLVGMLTIFSSVATVLQESGFIFYLANKKNVSQKEYNTVFWFNVFVSGIIYSLLFVFAPFIADFYKKPELISLSRFVFLGFFISSLGIIQNAILYRELKVKEKTIASVWGITLSGIIGVILAYNGFSYWGLAVQNVLNILICTIILWTYSNYRPTFSVNIHFLKQALPDGVRLMIPNIFTTFSNNIFSVVLGKMYSVSDVGNYSQAVKWNTSIYSVFSGMLRNVAQPILVRNLDDQERTLFIFRRFVKFTAFISIPLMIVFALVSKEVIVILLTYKWIKCAIILRILIVGGIFTIFTNLYSFFIISQNRTYLYMNMGILMSLFQLVGAIIASIGGSIYLAISYSMVSVVNFAIYQYYIKKSHSYSYFMFLNDVFQIVLCCMICCCLSHIFAIGIDNVYIRVLVKMISFFSIYILIMKIVKNDIMIDIINFKRMRL